MQDPQKKKENLKGAMEKQGKIESKQASRQRRLSIQIASSGLMCSISTRVPYPITPSVMTSLSLRAPFERRLGLMEYKQEVI